MMFDYLNSKAVSTINQFLIENFSSVTHLDNLCLLVNEQFRNDKGGNDEIIDFFKEGDIKLVWNSASGLVRGMELDVTEGIRNLTRNHPELKRLPSRNLWFKV